MITWRTPEFTYHEKDAGWYWLVIAAAVIVTLSAAWQRNFLFAVFVVIAAATLIAWARRQPQEIEFALTDTEIHIDTQRFPHKDFESFSLTATGGAWDRLSLQPKTKLRHYLILPIPHHQFDEIKKYCLNFWTEAEHPESLVEGFSRWLRF